jgi:hypothetical protein
MEITSAGCGRSAVTVLVKSKRWRSLPMRKITRECSVATGSGSWHCRGCGKGVSFVAIATQLYLCSGSRSRQRNRKPGVEFHDRNHSASFVALSARVLIDGVLLASAPRSASLPHCGSATRDLRWSNGRTRQSARLWVVHGLLPRALPPTPARANVTRRRCS